MKTFKDYLTHEVRLVNHGELKLSFYFKGVKMVTIQYERPKKTWTNKPILPQSAWKFAIAIATDDVKFIEGIVTWSELFEWSNEIISSSQKEVAITK